MLLVASEFEDAHERLLGDLDAADALHALLALLLLLQQLALAADVAAVALGDDVLPQGGDALGGDDFGPHGGLPLKQCISQPLTAAVALNSLYRVPFERTQVLARSLGRYGHFASLLERPYLIP